MALVRKLSKVCFVAMCVTTLLLSLARSEVVRSGGSSTVTISDGTTAYRQPSPVLPFSMLGEFTRGRRLFDAEIGRNSCVRCHRNDGKGVGLVELGRTKEQVVVVAKGHPARCLDRSLLMGNIGIESVLLMGRDLIRPRLDLSDPPISESDCEYTYSVRVAPALIGIGVIERLASENPSIRKDGVGVHVRDVSESQNLADDGRGKIFGYGMTSATVEEQIRKALLNDHSVNVCAQHSFCAKNTSNIEYGDFLRLNAYVVSLGVPNSLETERSARGRTTFSKIGCDTCHVGAARVRSAVGLLETVSPYSDFRLHDLGDELGGVNDKGEAVPSRWRTAPLWGIRFARSASPMSGFLHDGRARSIDEAIIWHGGEAAKTRERYIGLTDEDRSHLIDFIQTR